MYYELVTSIEEDYGIRKDPRLSDEIFFQAGELIYASITEPLHFECNNTSRHPPSDYTKMVIPVFSERFLSVVRNAGVDNLQAFRAELINHDTTERWKNYYAVNIVGKIACADMIRSRYTTIGAGMIEFDELVIKPDLAQGTLIFRLAESTRRIVIHESVIQHILDNDEPELTGYDVNELQ